MVEWAVVVGWAAVVGATALIAYRWGDVHGYEEGYRDGFEDPQGWWWASEHVDPPGAAEWRPRTTEERRAHLRIIDPRKEEPPSKEE